MISTIPVTYDVYIPRSAEHVEQMQDVAAWLEAYPTAEGDHMQHWTNTGLKGQCDQNPVVSSFWSGISAADLTQEIPGKTFKGDPWHIGDTFCFEDAHLAVLFKLTFGGAA